MNNLGILLIDMQENFYIEQNEKRRLVRTQLHLLDWAGDKQIPVFALKFKNKGGNILPELERALTKVESYIIPKELENGFYDNIMLTSLLEKMKINDLIFTGIYSHACVWETANAAKEEGGFNVFTSEELMNKSSINWYARWYQENTNYFTKADELMANFSNPNL